MLQKIERWSLLGLVALLCVLVGGLYFVKTVTPVPTPPSYGASAGTEHTNAENFYNDLNYNALSAGPLTVLAASSATAITAAQICGNGILSFAPSVIQASTTLPTAASLIGNCMRTVGDTRTVRFMNATSTSFLVLSGGTSSTLTVLGSSTISATPNVTNGKYLDLKFIYDNKAAGTVSVSGVAFE